MVHPVQFGSELISPTRNRETVMWLMAKRRKCIYYSEWKYWPSSPLLFLRSLYADFLQYLSGITKREYNSLGADSAHVIGHRLLVTGFSPRRWRVSKIVRPDNICVHRISSGLLIGSVTFLISSPLSSQLDPQGKDLGPELCMCYLRKHCDSFARKLRVKHVNICVSIMFLFYDPCTDNTQLNTDSDVPTFVAPYLIVWNVTNYIIKVTLYHIRNSPSAALCNSNETAVSPIRLVPLANKNVGLLFVAV
jgi:hypothetical protein